MTEKMHGRSKRNDDGSYEALDLKHVQTGDALRLTLAGRVRSAELIKTQSKEGDSTLENWRLVLQGMGETAVTLTVYGRMNKVGGTVRVPRVVLRLNETLLGVRPVDDQTAVFDDLGLITQMRLEERIT